MDLNEERKKKLDKIVELTDDSDISSIKRIVLGIIDIINNPRSTAKDLKELIEADPPLTAKVLRVANSAYYACRKKISDIQQAIIWIGFDALKEIALSQKVCEIFAKDESIDGYSRILLWKHSVAVALLGKMIYRMEFSEKGEDTYTAGLLHDIGIIVEDQFLQDDFKRILHKLINEKRNLTDAELDILGYTHADVGRALSSHWNFPQELIATMGYHHNPFNAPHNFSRMILTIYISDYICQESVIGYCYVPFPDKTLFHRCLKELRMHPSAVNLIVDEMKQGMSKMEDQGLF